MTLVSARSSHWPILLKRLSDSLEVQLTTTVLPLADEPSSS